MCCGSGVSCHRRLGSECSFVPRVFRRDRRHKGGTLIAVGRRVATFAVVAVSSQFVVRCACPVSG